MEWRPKHLIRSLRVPKYNLGEFVRCRDFYGFIDSIYLDYWAALDAFIIPEGWFEEQEHPISTKNQLFYGIVSTVPNGGSILAGEDTVTKEPF